MMQSMLQECCHLLCHQQPQIAYYTDSDLSSQPVLEIVYNHVESWSVAFVSHFNNLLLFQRSKFISRPTTFHRAHGCRFPNPNYFTLLR